MLIQSHRGCIVARTTPDRELHSRRGIVRSGLVSCSVIGPRPARRSWPRRSGRRLRLERPTGHHRSVRRLLTATSPTWVHRPSAQQFHPRRCPGTSPGASPCVSASLIRSTSSTSPTWVHHRSDLHPCASPMRTVASEPTHVGAPPIRSTIPPPGIHPVHRRSAAWVHHRSDRQFDPPVPNLTHVGESPICCPNESAIRHGSSQRRGVSRRDPS